MAALVLVPGFMQRGAAWEPAARAVGERYPSIALDHAAVAIERAAPDGSVLCGYSMGGRLALSAVLRDPGRYSALVLVGAGAGISDPAERQLRREEDLRLAAWMERSSIEEVVRGWEERPVFATQSEELVAAQRPGRLSFQPSELAALLRTAGQGTFEPVWDRLPSLELPVLAIAGELDTTYAAHAERVASLCPRGEAALIPSTGHAPHLERPDAFAAALTAFLDHAGDFDGNNRRQSHPDP